MALPGSYPAKKFSKEQEGEGERTLTNQFYKLDAPTSPRLEGLLQREVGKEEIKRAGHSRECGDPTSVHSPPLCPSKV